MTHDWHWLTGKTTDEDNPSAPFFRAPLLWILLPQVAAYTLCEYGFSLPAHSAFVAGVIASVLAAGALLAEIVSLRQPARFRYRDTWLFCLPIAVFFLAGAWWSAHAPRAVDWSAMPETELLAELRVETPFRSNGKSWSGLARAERVPDDCPELQNARIFYQFSKSETPNPPYEGMRFRLRGIARDISQDSWFDEGFREFLHSRRTSILLGNGDCFQELDSGINAALREKFLRLKSSLIEKLVNSQSPWEREQRILTAMMLGERKLLPPDREDDFMLTGTMHIFAVSGLHVSLFAAICFWIFSKCRLPYWGLAAGTLAISWFYVQLTGAAPSAMRAWIMIVFLLSARLFGRSSHPLNALILAAVIALWIQPSLWNSLGFQLSYSVVASIFLYGIPLDNALRKRWKPFKYVPAHALSRFQRAFVWLGSKLISLFSVSLGTFVAGAAFVAAHFGVFTPIAVLVNLILIPLVGILLGTAIASAVLFCIPVPGMSALAQFIWTADCMLMFGVEVLTGTAASLPGVFSVEFEHARFGTLGGAIILILFALGAFWEPLRSRSFIRFALPLIFLCAYLLAFAF